MSTGATAVLPGTAPIATGAAAIVLDAATTSIHVATITKDASWSGSGQLEFDGPVLI